MKFIEHCLDYSHAYTRADLTAAVHAAQCSGVYMAAALTGRAHSDSRAEAVQAWRRAEAIADRLSMSPENDADEEAIAAAKREAIEAREKLAFARMADDLAVSADARERLAELAAEAETVPETVRAAIDAGFIPASPDLDDLRARYDADVEAMRPARISCAPRREGFTVNTGGMR